MNVSEVNPPARRPGKIRAIPLFVLIFATCAAGAILGTSLRYWQIQSGRQQTIDELRAAGAEVINEDLALEVILTESADLAASLPLLSKLPDLWAIKITNSNFSDRDLRYFQQNSELEFLQIINTNVTGTGFSELIDQGRLSTLVMDGCPISVEGAKQITLLPSLRGLVVTRTTLTAGHLDAMHGLHASTVNLSNCNIDMPAFERILKSGKITRILLLETNFSPAEIERLRSSTPSVEIIAD